MDNIDILSQDLSSVDVSRPLLAPGLVELTVADVKIEPNKDQTKQNLNITLKTVNNERSVKSDTLNAGFTLFKTVSITPTDKYPLDRIQQELKTIRIAILGDAGKTGTFAPVDQYIGRSVMGRVSVSSDKAGVFPDRNEVKLVQK